MRPLVKRNLTLFFRDKSAVFFSLLSVFIIIGLYVLFLGEVMVKSMPDLEGVRFLMDSWIMAGMLAVTPITTALGSLENMISDKKNKVYKDFAASPVKRSTLIGGYIISTFIISLVMTFVTFILAQVYIVIQGGELLSFVAMLKVFGLIIYIVISACFMMFFLVTCFKSTQAFSVASTIIGTLIGFLTGIYIPIGTLPEAVQVIVKLFPPSHAAVLLRQIMMQRAEEIAFAGASEKMIEGFRLSMGASFQVGNSIISPYVSLLYIFVVTAIFIILSMRRISKKAI